MPRCGLARSGLVNRLPLDASVRSAVKPRRPRFVRNARPSSVPDNALLKPTFLGCKQIGLMSRLLPLLGSSAPLPAVWGRVVMSRRRYARWVAVGALAVSAVVGCGSSRSFVWVSDYVSQGSARAPRPLRPGDRIQVVVRGQDTLGTQAEIRPDGEVVLPVVGSVVAGSRTPTELANEIASRLVGVVQSPSVTVIVERRRTIVTVLGEVRGSGRFELEPGEGLLQILARAGGLTPFADSDAIFVLRRDPQLARIRFRYDELAGGDPVSVGFELRDGDTVMVE